MKILFVIDSLGSGGAQRQMVTLALALSERGHHVEFFIYYPEYHFLPLLEQANIVVRLHKKPSRFSIAPVIALWRILKSGLFNVVLAFLNTPCVYAEIACLPFRNVKLIVSERSSYPVGNLKVGRILQQQMHRLANWITVNSHHQRKRMEQEFPWMKGKILTIYNGYDLDKFRPLPYSPSHRQVLNLIAISSVSFNKNSLNLAKALKICRDQHNLTVNLDWVGTQQVSNEGMRPSEETDAFLKNTGLADQWQWLGVRTNIPQLIALRDALIHPSYLEGLPNVVCEALACGRPVLASKVCDHPLLVTEGVSGFLFDPTSPEDIARVILAFSRQSIQERLTMAENARRYAEVHLSIARYADEYENLLRELTENLNRGV